MDWTDLIFDYLWDYVSEISGIIILAIFFGVVLIAVTYAFPRYALYLRGKKAGVENGWKAFVPFFSVHYKLKILNEPWWKIFFFDEFQGLCIGLISLFYLSFNQTVQVLTTLMIIIYYVASAIFYIKYYCELFRRFGYNASLGVFYWMPGVGAVPKMIELIMSFDNSKVFNGGPGDPPPPPSGAYGIRGVTGSYQGAFIKISKGETIVFGRDGQICNIVFDANDTRIGRKHCSVTLGSSDGYIVTDFSTNGTLYDDGRKFPSGMPVPVPRGTIICIASKAQRFMLE